MHEAGPSPKALATRGEDFVSYRDATIEGFATVASMSIGTAQAKSHREFFTRAAEGPRAPAGRRSCEHRGIVHRGSPTGDSVPASGVIDIPEYARRPAPDVGEIEGSGFNASGQWRLRQRIRRAGYLAHGKLHIACTVSYVRGNTASRRSARCRSGRNFFFSKRDKGGRRRCLTSGALGLGVHGRWPELLQRGRLQVRVRREKIKPLVRLVRDRMWRSVG